MITAQISLVRWNGVSLVRWIELSILRVFFLRLFLNFIHLRINSFHAGQYAGINTVQSSLKENYWMKHDFWWTVSCVLVLECHELNFKLQLAGCMHSTGKSYQWSLEVTMAVQPSFSGSLVRKPPNSSFAKGGQSLIIDQGCVCVCVCVWIMWALEHSYLWSLQCQ